MTASSSVTRQSAPKPVFAFPRCHRLLTSRDYQRVFDDPVRVSGQAFTLLARSGDQEHARLGLVVAKRNAARAVLRNRVKRQVREAFRRRQDRLPAMDMIVIARRGIDKLDKRELADALAELWGKLERKCKSS